MVVELTSLTRGGDVMQAEGNPLITRESKVVENTTEIDWDLPAGYPIDDNVAVIAANIANTDGLLCQPVHIPAGETRKVAVLARGPAAVNADALPLVDYVAAAINAANFKTAIEALGIVVREEPDNQEVQET